MTTAGLRWLRGWDAGGSPWAVAGVAAWAAAVLALHTGLVQTPDGRLANALTFAVPAALVAWAFLRRADDSRLPLLAGTATAIAAATVLPGYFAGNPKLALALPVLVVGGVLTQRYPTFALSAVFAFTGTYGSLKAFAGIPGDSVADKFISALWAGVIGRLLVSRRSLRVRATPTLFMLGGFMILAIMAMITTSPMESGIRAFRLGPLYLSLVLLLGYGGFRAATLERFSRVVACVCLVVAAYAALRWAIGTSAKEQALQRTAFEQQYNRLANSGDLKTQGSLPNGNLLGLWMACTTPFLVAIVVSSRGLLRMLAAAALPLSVIGLLASGNRIAAASVVAGGLTVVVIHMLSRGFRGPRLGVAVTTALLLTASASIVYPAVVDNPEKRKRYENVLTPSEDLPFQERLTKWRATLDALKDEPFGFGLGAGNPIAIRHRFADIGHFEIDNSYLMVAYDQGLVVMAFFIVAMLVLLFELLRFAVWTRGPGQAALAAGAVGTLVAMLVEFMGANYIVAPPVVAGWMIVGLGVAQMAGSAQPRQTLSASRTRSRTSSSRTPDPARSSERPSPPLP